MSAIAGARALTPVQVEHFNQQGYVILEQLLPTQQIAPILQRFDPLFNTQFETGIYPDEWYGRPGLSQPHATRHMTGLWRCDRALASITLASPIAQLMAGLMGWRGSRYAFDGCWIKPPGAPAVSFHRNNTYVSSIAPATVVTCWIALSHAMASAGTLEIVPGSHRWACTDRIRFLHAPREDYRAPLWQAAAEAGVTSPTVMPIELAPGSAIVFHGDLWHGSGVNHSADQTRCSLSISTLPDQAQFQPPGVGQGYIFNRYRRQGELTMDESFFPVLWANGGDRTPFLADYCRNL